MKNKKLLALVCCMALLIGAVGATLAWLTAQTTEVKNVFTASDININLTETKTEFEMVPGHVIDKDPVVTVKGGSEDCYVFIRVTESPDAVTFSKYLAYKIDSKWKPVEGMAGVYYQEIASQSNDKQIDVLSAGTYKDMMGTESTVDDITIGWYDDQVGVKPSVTKEMMEDIINKRVPNPTLTFKAYAVQLYKNNTDKFTVAEAWAQAQALENN